MTSPAIPSPPKTAPSDTVTSNLVTSNTVTNDLVTSNLVTSDFVTSAFDIQGYPPLQQTSELAFAGRSNVGKSSLINALLRRQKLARTSNTPGCTQGINFYTLRHKDTTLCSLADLPGYGYARVSRKTSSQWQRLSWHYLEHRAPLRSVFLLLDSRRGIGEKDEAFMDMMDVWGVSCQLVLTKVDKISQAQLAKSVADITARATKHATVQTRLFPVSSRSRQGLEVLWARMTEYFTPHLETQPTQATHKAHNKTS